MNLTASFSRMVDRFKAVQGLVRSVSVIAKPNMVGLFPNDRISFPQAVEEGYKNLVWVYRCISAYSTAVSSCPWQVFSVRGNDETLQRGHPLEVLLNRPNNFFGRREFFETSVAHLFLAGKCYWEKVIGIAGDNKGKPIELWNVRPDWMYPDQDPVLFISGWTFDPKLGPSKKIKFSTDQIVDFKFSDPMDAYGAISPLTAASRTIDVENSAILWNKSILDNAAVPGGIFKIPAMNVTKQQRDELRGSIEANFTSGDRFRTMILWGGMDWTRMSFSPQDMQFLEQRRLNKYEICSIFGVPPQMVGAQEDPTYSNYAVARLSFWEDQVIPLLDWIAAKATFQLAPAFGPGLVVRPNLSAVPALREAFKQKVDTAYKMWQMRFPINAINRRLNMGMEIVPWGDMAYDQLNLVPMDQLGHIPDKSIPTDPNAVDDPGDPQTEMD